MRCVTTVSKWSYEPESKKTLKLTVNVFAAPGLPPAHFLTAESGFKPCAPAEISGVFSLGSKTTLIA